jgi:methionine-rich copper-binding protein CopC
MRLLRPLAIVLAAAALATSAMAPADAHSRLVSTSPADGAVLSEPPATVSFTFDEDLLPGTDTISVNDDAGNVIATAAVEPEGATISMPWPAEATSGTFQVAFRVVSGDGHPVTGAISLTLSGQPASSGSPSSGAGTEATPPATASAAASSPAASTPPATAPRGIAAWLVVVLALIVLALIAFVAVALIHRRG